MLKRILLLGAVLLIGSEILVAQIRRNPERFQVLLFTKSISYPNRHNSISDGVEMFQELSSKNSFGLTWTDDAAIFDDTSRLNNMDVIVFLNTSGIILNESQKKAFQDYIHNGGNFVGIHSASYTFVNDWPWYAKLLGAWWNRHPGIHTAVVKVENANHPSTVHLPSSWIITEEWFNFQNISDKINVLLTVNEKTYPGGKMPNYHPIAWYQDNFEGGRSFFTLLGHTEEIYHDPLYQQHITGALWWAAMGIELDTNLPNPNLKINK